MSRFTKGSAEAKAYMAAIRAKKKGKGLFGDVAKFVGNKALDYAPVPGIARDVGKHVLNYGVDKSGLGMRKKKYGCALNLP
jgi:hypothetical protein